MTVKLPNEEEIRLKQIWNQKLIPVVLRRGGKGERLRLRLPTKKAEHRYEVYDFDWLKGCGKSLPDWNKKLSCWELPKLWFNEIVNSALSKYKRIYVIQPFREYEICAPACQNAVGHECSCSCMGEHHGTGGDSSWFEVSETFAYRSGEKSLASRLLTKKE